MASSQDAVIQELLFRLASVYIDRLTNSINERAPQRRSLKSADDLVRLIFLVVLARAPSFVCKIPHGKNKLAKEHLHSLHFE